jgi:hypothetical protein
MNVEDSIETLVILYKISGRHIPGESHSRRQYLQRFWFRPEDGGRKIPLNNGISIKPHGDNRLNPRGCYANCLF